MPRLIKFIGIFVSALILAGCTILADRIINTPREKPPYQISVEAQKIHQQLTVIDLHADTLLWDRDLLVRSSYGHVDVPKMREGNIALQVFAVVTRVPLFLGVENNSDSPDIITMLTWEQEWPEASWDSLMERAVYQAHKLQDRTAASKGVLIMIKSQEDLAKLLKARQQGEQVMGAMLALEGAHALEAKPENVDRLYAEGFRMLGLAHFFDNEMSGSAHGKKKYGLTPAGLEMVKKAQAKGMIIDLAHASPEAIDDVLAISQVPVLASHTGVKATCDSPRNLSDEQLHAIAKTGGIVGIGLFKLATCGKTISDTVKAIRHAVDLIGVEHVALGSDWDGTIAVIDSSGVALLTEALLNSGFTQQQLKAMMGGNAIRVFKQVLPAR